MDINTTIKAINSSHSTANFALENKDLATYIDCFSDDLQYKQMNGKTIDKNQLSTDIKKYFNRIKNSTSVFDRLSFSVDNDSFIEEIKQKAKVNIRLFIFFSKQWTVERTATYTWKQINNVWKIFAVVIISEKLS